MKLLQPVLNSNESLIVIRRIRNQLSICVTQQKYGFIIQIVDFLVLTMSFSLNVMSLLQSSQLYSLTELLSIGLLTSLFYLNLGYAGYIPGVKSENLYGQTYGKTTYSSSANDFHRGIDQPADIKFSTTMKKEFIHHATQQHETVAQTVGVERGNSTFTRVSKSKQEKRFFFKFYSDCFNSLSLSNLYWLFFTKEIRSNKLCG